MYFLAKFCRICVQTGDKLIDLDTVDFDEIKLSEKLEICTKMVVTKESLSSEICGLCLAKLRVSYEFTDMCKKSHKKLQGYLKAILAKSNDEKVEDFVNTDINVVVTPLRGYEDEYYACDNADFEHPHAEVHFKEKRKRITKEQRCSLLKRLLTTAEPHRKNHDKYFYNNYYKSTFCEKNVKGGLRNIINFTKNYEFGNPNCANKQASHLDKLKAFSEEFFQKDFSDFKNTILYIIENKSNIEDSGDSEDDLFDSPDEEETFNEDIVKFEEVIVEPDLKIKTEIDFEEEEGECVPPDHYGEYGEQNKSKIYIKQEDDCSEEEKESKLSLSTASQHHNESFATSSNSMQILNNFVGSYSHRRTFFSNNVRCRTRDNPYINPLLKEQFLYRSFKCDKCSRYFKSQGYLKAHYTKIH